MVNEGQNLKKIPKLPISVVKKPLNNIRSKVEADLKKITDRKNSINSKIIIDKNKSEKTRNAIMGELFKSMKEFGVDLSNLDSINQFLQALETQDPDLANLFNLAFTKITNPNNQETQENQTEDVGLLNKFNNLGKDILQPRKQNEKIR